MTRIPATRTPATRRAGSRPRLPVLQRARLETAVLSYSFWLDVRGVPGRRRRDLARELRANLVDAAGSSGARAAVEALGGTRRLAAEAAPPDPDRPRWYAGLSAGVAALAAVVLLEVLAGLAWVDGVLAADPDRRVAGSLTLFPGSRVSYSPLADGLAVSVQPGWLGLAVGLLAFVVVARPWRVLRARHAAAVGRA